MKVMKDITLSKKLYLNPKTQARIAVIYLYNFLYFNILKLNIFVITYFFNIVSLKTSVFLVTVVTHKVSKRVSHKGES